MTTAKTAGASAPTRYMQGIAVPAESVNPTEFFARTRRHLSNETSRSYGGGGGTTIVELRKADILSSIQLRFVGQVTVTGGTTNSTAAWPLGIAGVRFTANGQSNLINTGAAGLVHLRARDLMKNSDLTDRGVEQTIAGVLRRQGTMALASENWGIGSQTTGITAGTYSVDLTFNVPVSEDERDLVGAIFLQTATSDLTLSIDETPVNQLFNGGTATGVSISGQWQVQTTKFSIPVGPNGQIVVPNLSVFHSIINSRVGNGIALGENEHRIIGQGAGKSLLRIWGRVLNGASPAPLPMTAANFGPLSWRFGNNEQPDTFLDGSAMRADMERRYNADLGAYWGYFCHDFAAENAFRDVVDMGTTAELRLVNTIQNAVTLNSPALEYCAETVFLAGQGA
jgi:hypothetical protein